MSDSKGALTNKNRSSALTTPRNSCTSGHSYRSDNTGDQRTVISGVSSNGFKIGDRVSVGSSRKGTICFIGKTKFADGEWAGINLDEPEGKNDGSVNGIRYFQCPSKHGLFSRLSTLTLDLPKQNTAKQQLTKRIAKSSISLSIDNGKNSLGMVEEQSSNKSPDSGILKAAKDDVAVDCPLKVGMRVTVGGTRQGTLRFVGSTEFAKGKGLFAGVELDEPSGKNDGAVDGERYFSCKPRFGLFAPVHRVHPLHTDPAECATGNLGSVALPLVQSAQYGSQESISSTSSSRATRTRLGVISLTSSVNPVNHPKAGSSPTETLKKVVQEKQEHIEQLLREREHERSEIARAQAQVEEAEEARIATERLLTEAHDKIEKLKISLANCEREKDELGEKVEDLQFRMAEELVDESSHDQDTAQVTTLLRQISTLEMKLKDREEAYCKLSEELNKISNYQPSECASVSTGQFCITLNSETQTENEKSEGSLDFKSSGNVNFEKEQTSFFELNKQLQSNFEIIDGKRKEVNSVESVLATKENEVTEKEKILKSVALEMENRSAELAALQCCLNEREEKIKLLEEEAKERGLIRNASELAVKQRENSASDLEKRLAAMQIALESRKAQIDAESLTIVQKKAELEERELSIHENECNMTKLKLAIEQQESAIASRLNEISSKEAQLLIDQQELKKENVDLQSLKEYLTKLQSNLELKEVDIAAKGREAKDMFEKFAEREASLIQKEDKINRYETYYESINLAESHKCKAQATDTDRELHFKAGDNSSSDEPLVHQKAISNLSNTDQSHVDTQTDEGISSNQLQHQIEFLNSVIVDLRCKNEKLQLDIRLLTEPELKSPGTFQAVSNYQIRPYCDICEEFDLHETEDCPIQTGENSLVCQERNSNDRKYAVEHSGDTRPYCDACEKFGHSTMECNNDDETY